LIGGALISYNLFLKSKPNTQTDAVIQNQVNYLLKHPPVPGQDPFQGFGDNDDKDDVEKVFV
jgi:hypothetical protein